MSNPTWKKAQASNSQGNCVEVLIGETDVQVRDSKLGDDSPVLHYTFAEWRAFLDGVEGGEFDLEDDQV